MLHLNKTIQLLLFVSLPWRAFPFLTSNFSSILPPAVKRETTRLIGFIDWDDAAPSTRLRDLANAVYNYVDVSHWANQTANEQARRIHLMCAAYGWDDPIAIVNDFEADLQQALRNHEQASRVGAVKVFAQEVRWMRLRAQELRLALLLQRR